MSASPTDSVLGDPPRSVTISAGPYTAVLSGLGAGLSRLTYKGYDLVMPTDPLTTPPGYAGQTLLPWPNRLRDGLYSWQGEEYALECNDEATHTALHGLVADKWWDFQGATSTWAEWSIVLSPTPGYPWELMTLVRYDIDAERGLSVAVVTTNTSPVPVPYGVSHHPYVMPGGGTVDDWTLCAPPATVLTSDEQLIPVGSHPVAMTEHDFAEPTPMRDRSVDHCFTNLPIGEWQVSVAHQDTGVATHLHATSAWLQMYTGDYIGRAGLAVEPMTCPPNAFATGEDVITLEPDGTHIFDYRITGSVDQ